MRLSRYGGDCYAYCMLAAGHVDLVIETELKPYDVLAARSDHKARAASSRPGTASRPRRRPRHRRRRQPRARGRDGVAEGLTARRTSSPALPLCPYLPPVSIAPLRSSPPPPPPPPLLPNPHPTTPLLIPLPLPPSPSSPSLPPPPPPPPPPSPPPTLRARIHPTAAFPARRRRRPPRTGGETGLVPSGIRAAHPE